jgi:hypothetical protein
VADFVPYATMPCNYGGAFVTAFFVILYVMVRFICFLMVMFICMPCNMLCSNGIVMVSMSYCYVVTK